MWLQIGEIGNTSQALVRTLVVQGNSILKSRRKCTNPNHEFIDKWDGHCDGARLDNVDMVDWPIAMESHGNASSTEKS